MILCWNGCDDIGGIKRIEKVLSFFPLFDGKCVYCRAELSWQGLYADFISGRNISFLGPSKKYNKFGFCVTNMCTMCVCGGVFWHVDSF